MPLLATYAGISRCWKIFLCGLHALILLFQGKKRNVQRSRIDHHNFNLDQLLIGAILLSVFVFLFPSVFMYYIGFVLCWLCVVGLYSMMAAIVFCCNHLPLFLLGLG